MLLYLALKNITSKKSSFVITAFIAFAIMLLTVTNSVFDSTEKGVQETFVSSFTGDIVIRPSYKSPLSLFGDETPVTGKHTVLPSVIPYNEIISYLEQTDYFLNIVPQVTGLCAMTVPSKRTAACIFGVPSDKYLSCMTSLKILEGEPWKTGEKGVMLSKKLAQELNVHTGEMIEFIVSEGFSSKIRAAPLCAIYEYKIENPVMDSIVLVNPETVRELTGMNDYLSEKEIVLSEELEDILSETDMDSLFEDAGDLSEQIYAEETSNGNDGTEGFEADTENLSENSVEDSLSSSSWNFIILKLKKTDRTAAVIKKLNAAFSKQGWPVEAVNWRSSAGNTAFYLYILRLILNSGIIIILSAGFIVVNNTLIINVLDRIREIGTMRAIGANKRYIIKECAAETIIMSVFAGIAGCILGSLVSVLISSLNITITNSFLIQLFGGVYLKTELTFSNLALSFLLSVLLGLVAWIYPVINALKINPVEAMQGAK